MPRTLYIIDGSPPARMAWMACVAAGVDVDIHRMDTLEKRDQLEDWFVKMNPKHCVPTLNDNGFILWESRAIMRYVVDALSDRESLYPKDHQQRALVNRHLDYDLGTLFKHKGALVWPEIFLNGPPQDQTNLRKELEYLEKQTPLAEGKFITGDTMTIADIASIVSVTFLEAIDFDYSDYPNLMVWVEKMKAQDFYKECNVGFEKWKQEIKTDEWKIKNEKRVIANGRKVYKSYINKQS